MESDDWIDDKNLLSPRIRISEWTTAACFALCREVEFRPELWDVTNERYRDRSSIRRAWNEIAIVFKKKYSSEECARKWQSLRASHRRERSKLKAKKSKSRLGAIEPPTWPFFTAMKFLISSLSTNSTIKQSNLDLDEESLDNSIDGKSTDGDPNSIGGAERHKFPSSISSAASTSRSEFRERIDECRSEIAVARCRLNDEDRILSNFVFSSSKTMEPKSAARLRHQIKSLILKEMLAETEDIETRHQQSTQQRPVMEASSQASKRKCHHKPRSAT